MTVCGGPTDTHSFLSNLYVGKFLNVLIVVSILSFTHDTFASGGKNDHPIYAGCFIRCESSVLVPVISLWDQEAATISSLLMFHIP